MKQTLLIKLNIYEGPLDLLLHLIKKNEIDLNDIPIALITAQYLEYLDLMESLNVELAADFLLMAATLIQIKSKLLLPTEDNPEEETAFNDIQAEIIDPLLAHIKFKGLDFKDATAALNERPRLNCDVFTRGLQFAINDGVRDNSLGGPFADKLIEVSLIDLVDAFKQLSERKKQTKTLHYLMETKTVGERILEIQQFLKNNPKVTFENICRHDHGQNEMILSFLAVLELAKINFLRLYQDLDHSKELLIFLANPKADLSALSHLEY
ncbi:MAG: segregation and condensation protein A [Candidatus Adiutrix sp.]